MKKKEIGLIGIKPSANDFIKKYGPIEAVSLGIKRTWEISVLTIVSAKLIQRVIPMDSIGGPVLRIGRRTGIERGVEFLCFHGYYQHQPRS